MWLLFAFLGPALAADSSRLLLGNSYTSYNNLSGATEQLFEELIGDASSFKTASLTQGGFQWVQHESALSNSSSQHSNRFYGDDWDWVLLQEQSQIPGFPLNQTDRINSGQAALALNQRIEDIGANTLLYMTWGRRW